MSASADEQLQRVERMVRRFYELGLADPVLGPIFRNAIHDWEPHIAVVRDFWSGAIHGTQRYLGNAYAPHARIDFTHDAFAHWLQAFETASQEVLLPAEAETAIRIARHHGAQLRGRVVPLHRRAGEAVASSVAWARPGAALRMLSQAATHTSAAPASTQPLTGS